MGVWLRVWNVVALLVVITVLVLHLVCTATQRLGGLDVMEYRNKIQAKKERGIATGDLTPVQVNLMEAQVKMLDWLHAVAGLFITGLIIAILAAIVAVMGAYTPSRGLRQRIFPVLMCFLAFTAGVVILCGDIIFGVYGDTLLKMNQEKVFQILKEQNADTGVSFNKTELGEVLTDLDNAKQSLIYMDWGFFLDIACGVLLVLIGCTQIVAVVVVKKDSSAGNQNYSKGGKDGGLSSCGYSKLPSATDERQMLSNDTAQEADASTPI